MTLNSFDSNVQDTVGQEEVTAKLLMTAYPFTLTHENNVNIFISSL